MTETEKLIIDKLDFLGTEIDDVKTELGEVRTELKSDIEGVRTELKSDIEGVRTELKSDIEGVRTELQTEIDDMKDDLLRINVILENDVSQKINVIAEGHDFLKMNLEEARRMESKREKMELEIIDNHLEILKIKSHLRLA